MHLLLLCAWLLQFDGFTFSDFLYMYLVIKHIWSIWGKDEGLHFSSALNTCFLCIIFSVFKLLFTDSETY